MIVIMIINYDDDGDDFDKLVNGYKFLVIPENEVSHS